MYNIAQFLNKFKNIGASDTAVRQAVIDLVKEQFSFTIELKNVKYKNSTLTLDIHPVAKNAIHTKKQHFLNEIKNRTRIEVKEIR